MNKIIEDQLKKLKLCKVPPYTPETLELFIPKQELNKKTIFDVNSWYIIQLEHYIINPPPDFNLHSNWNKGIVPKYEFMKAQVLQCMGKMLKIKGVGYDITNNLDTSYIWEGWLPSKSVKIIEKL